MINAFFLIIYVLFADSFSGVELSYILSFHCALCMILHLRQNKRELVTPVSLFYLGVILVNYANLSMIASYRNGTLKSSSFLVPVFIHEAITLWCISCTLIIIGYHLARKKSFASIAIEISSKKVFRTLFYVLLVLNVRMLLSPGSTTPLGGNFKLVNVFSILFFARLWAKENNNTYRLYALSLYLITTFVALKYAFLRFDLIFPTISLFAGFFIGKGNLKYLLTYRVIPFILIIVVYASVFKTLQSHRANFYSVVFNENNENESSKETDNSGTGLLERTSNLAQLTSIFRLVKQNGFYNGRASEPLIAAVVPRFLWPDKPIIALGSWFAGELTGSHYVKGSPITNSINMMICGELYLDFGWLGVVIGSLLTGAFFCVLWNSTQFYSSQYNFTGIIFGGYLLILAMSTFGADLQIVITIMSMYVTLFLIKKIAKAK
jgi:hypothetical protein